MLQVACLSLSWTNRRFIRAVLCIILLSNKRLFHGQATGSAHDTRVEAVRKTLTATE
jgi:hypothetical protein